MARPFGLPGYTGFVTADCDVLILGAGIAGLLAARALQARGRHVVLLDKGRGVGGRLATRRFAEGAAFDHGAQFFTVRNPQFQAIVDELLQASIVREWCRGFAGPDLRASDDGHPRYAGVSGMSAIPKHLARDLDVRPCHKVLGIHAVESVWEVAIESADTLRASSLLMTPPVPQSLALIEHDLPADSRQALESLTYDPCVSLMILLNGESPLPEPGGVQIPDGEPVSWLADNRRKGTSSQGGPAITIHAGPQFTRDTWDVDAETVAADLLRAAQPYLGDVSPISYQLHRWRYSKPQHQHPDRCVVVDGPPRVVFAGDAFGEPRVEGAALSGLAAADQL